MPHQFRLTIKQAEFLADTLLKKSKLLSIIDMPGLSIFSGPAFLSKARLIQANWFFLGYCVTGLDSYGNYSEYEQGNANIRLLQTALLNKGFHFAIRSYFDKGTIVVLSEKSLCVPVPNEYSTIPMLNLENF